MNADATSSTANDLLYAPLPGEVRDDLDRPYPVTDEQQQFYQENGFVKVEGILQGETLAYSRRLIGAAVAKYTEDDDRLLEDKSQYEQSFMQCKYLCWLFPAVRTFVFSKRFAGAARDFMGADGVRLWHDQALYKEPGGRLTDCPPGQQLLAPHRRRGRHHLARPGGCPS